MCLNLSPPEMPKAAIPPAVKPLGDVDTTVAQAKPLAGDVEQVAKTEYGSDKVVPPEQEKKEQNAASLRIPLGGSQQVGAGTGGLNQA